MRLSNKMFPCQSREAVVTVLSYHNGIIEVYLQHPRLEKREKVCSLSQIVLLLNSLLNLEDSLGSPLPLVHRDCDNLESIAVFRIQILFREHYTWQGKLVWQDETKETVFHSCIELMQLIDEILGE